MSKVVKPLKVFTVTAQQVMSKTVNVVTDKYKLKEEYDEETGKCFLIEDDKETNWKEIFEKEHWDIASLLSVLEEYIKLDMSKHISDRRQRQLEVLLMACNDWHEDKYEVTKIK